jgi:hypothetical protein
LFSFLTNRKSFRLLLLTAALCVCSFVRAQGDLRFFGTATKDSKPLSGAVVTVLMDGKQIISLATGKNGKFKFTIDLGHNYRINFSAPGCVDMFMTMDLHVPPDKAWIYPDYVSEIPFFSPNDAKVKTEVFAQNPFIKVVFDGSKGFYDDPKYRFIDAMFKDPLEEQRKKEELAKKEAEDKARREAEERNQKEEQERLRLQQLEEQERRKKDEEAERNKRNVNANDPTETEAPSADPSMETDAIRLEREKQEKLNRTKQNKNVRTQYENNLLKLVAESEKRNNLQKFNKMKGDAEGNSVVQVMRMEALVKAQNGFLIEQKKQRQKQTLANKQLKEKQVKELVVAGAFEDRDQRSNHLRPAVNALPLNYTPSPHVVMTLQDGFFSDITSTVISWPGGKRNIFHVKEYWWGARYYYRDDVEIDAATYNAEIYKYKRH